MISTALSRSHGQQFQSQEFKLQLLILTDLVGRLMVLLYPVQGLLVLCQGF